MTDSQLKKETKAFISHVKLHADLINTTEEFFEYFNTDFNGKIIHWTNLKY